MTKTIFYLIRYRTRLIILYCSQFFFLTIGSLCTILHFEIYDSLYSTRAFSRDRLESRTWATVVINANSTTIDQGSLSNYIGSEKWPKHSMRMKAPG